MTRDEAIERLRKVMPYLSHETNSALDVVLVDSMNLNAHYKKPFYYCDPEKNKACNKGGCFKTGGPCYVTTKEDCAVIFSGRSLKAPILEVGVCD